MNFHRSQSNTLTRLNALFVQSIPNIFTAFTNFAALIPLYICSKSGDDTTSSLVFFAAVSSFFSHLFESHKHGMIGFGVPRSYSYYLNRVDVVAACLLFLRACFIFYGNYKNLSFNQMSILFGVTSLSFICNKIGESETTIKTRTRYLILHNIWHVSIFSLLGYLLHILKIKK
jgi:hypothetical protein